MMNRQAMQTALGRTAIEGTSRQSTTHISTRGRSSTRALAHAARRPLSTTSARLTPADDRPSGRDVSQAAASKLGQLSPSRTSSPAPRAGSLDARSLGASAPGPAHRVFAAPRGGIQNLRSLRGRGGAASSSSSSSPNHEGTFAPRFAGPGVTAIRGRFAPGAPRAGGATRGRGGFGAGASTSGPGGARVGYVSRGRGRGGAARGRGRGRGGKKDGDRKKENDNQRESTKLVWSADEQAVFNRLEQGVVTPYAPSLTLESLAGYGPAVATDAALGGVETAMRSMRVLGAQGRPFNADSGATADSNEAVKRYFHDKKPLFFNTPEEKAFLARGTTQGFRIAPAAEETKKAIVDAAVRGKYEAPTFAAVGDVLGTLASYHGRDVSYKVWDAQSFTAKVESLLPANAAATLAAAQAAKKTQKTA
ncbi:hypothetical protein B0T17DRAFT_536820 [Bombardia bombarda]|uniref:Uncharacterized protein n=1 Tax=Bombardia bombarda TaxID=252184 RepID=A0AA39WMC8_9PEZI|nr:hypothetical protein B0T17DRAFT_536820 [Bombardia bombarda]